MANFHKIKEIRHTATSNSGVYVVLQNDLRGWVDQGDRVYALLAAARMAGTPGNLHLAYAGHNPNWGHDKSGHFFDVIVIPEGDHDVYPY